MKAIKYILVVLITVVLTAAALFFLAAAVAPKTFTVKRTAILQASPQNIFNQINSLQKVEAWGPWQKQDTTIKNTYTGPASGIGNKTMWTSKKSGSGWMEIIESAPPTSIKMKVGIGNFNPFTAHYTLNAVEGGTQVSWEASGTMNYPWNIFSMFADKTMGPDFETGLANLKLVVENNPDWKLGEFKIEEQPAQPILAIKDSCTAADIGKTLGRLYGEIGRAMQKNKLDFVAAPMAYFYSFSTEKVVLEAAIPVAKEIKGEGLVKGRTTEAGKVVAVTFFGDYALMSEAMPSIQEYMKQNKLVQNGPECDIYITDPTTVREKIEVQTRMVFPVKQQ
jgi:effector-binding domain-containing protein